MYVLRREIGSREIKAQHLFFAVRQRESKAERDKDGRRERAEYILVTPCFVSFTFRII